MNFFLFFSLLAFIITANAQLNCSHEPDELQFLFMASNGSSFNTYSSLVGVDMALERINSNSSLLSNFTLSYSDAVDSQCLRTPSLSEFLSQITAPCSNFLAVIGSGCSVATDPVAEIGPFWGLSQVSYSSSSVHLRDRNRFKNYFQIYVSESNYIPGIAAIMTHYEWSRVVIITEKVTLFTETEESLIELLNTKSIVATKISFESDEDPANISDLFPESGRIFFLNMWEPKARQVICEAYKRRLTDRRKYAWILYGWYSNQWWTIPSTETPNDPFACTSDQLYSVLNGALAVQQYPINTNVTKRVIGDLSYNDFYALYNARLNSSNSSYRNFQPTYVAHMAYDATWSLALALDKTAKRIAEGQGPGPDCNGTLTPLDQWSNTITTTSCVIRYELGRTSFEGLSGNVSFDEDGIRPNSRTRIYQIRNNEQLLVASWFQDEFIYLNNQNTETVFPDGVPSDGTPIRIISTFHASLVVIFYTISFVGLVFCAICLIFTFYFRNKKLIKLISPNLNYFIIAGTSMVFLSIFLRTFPFDTSNEEEFKSTRLVFCYISLYLDFIGYTIAFGTILSKMWRIYYIFHNPSPNKKILTDWHLMGIILLITGGMVFILIIGSAIPQTRLKLSLESDRENSNKFNERGVPLDYYVYHCFTTASYVWLIFLYIYLGMLQIIAIILAMQTRKVRIKILNDSKEVATIIYITSIVLVELVIVSFALSSFYNTHEVLYDIGLLIVAFAILLVIFAPKMYRLYKDPEGEKCDTTQITSTVEFGKSGAFTVVSDKEKIDRLQNEVMELKSQLDGRRASSSTYAENGDRKLSVSFIETSMVSLPIVETNN
ncbi:PREDICTED: gamma-aminobutyric acid type B receptor subunit 1-like [Amphimedon queenslandica]|uniref:G-protein coupled receptors family 3 profile domain-containing protein n=1 Tax=Amphimedon queenslandica TaxID=400682 RepID=A0A1X7UG59_AMPQE|nr:PREDICTED: gamma-aminobutyric acid type B receptor subunit 1-like [Amphimedon queenslandica]|eukprot:XP_011405199.1 PREDICTED: gamma-aminobutyric acid type B receptor subunit 1-like [Amphimedon queenslandica]